MNLKQALAILTREKHNGHTRWDGTCPPGSAAWRTEFECIVIAEAYERMRGPDPCAALRARLESAEAALRDAHSLIGDLYDNGCWNDAEVAEIWMVCARLDAATGAAGEKDKPCQD